jgi:hypothetical protein
VLHPSFLGVKPLSYLKGAYGWNHDTLSALRRDTMFSVDIFSLDGLLRRFSVEMWMK